jgi:Fungal specific transcription factor domain
MRLTYPLQYEYLMHALLGLAASHLTITSDSDYSSSALSHRFLAIKGLNEALSITPRKGHDGDALLASCYALTFQSSYMTDGLHEFLTFLRGCNLVSAQLIKENVRISFDFASGGHSKNSLLKDDLPAINPDFVREAAFSLELLPSVIQGCDINLELYNALKDCVQSSTCSSQEGLFDLKSPLHSGIFTRVRIHEIPSNICTSRENGSAKVSRIYSSR